MSLVLSLEKDPQQEKSFKDTITSRSRCSGNFLTNRLFLPSSSKRVVNDDEMFMVQKSIIEARSQRSRRPSKADNNQLLEEISRRCLPTNRLTSVASLESAASDLADHGQANTSDAQPPGKRSSLLRRLSSSFRHYKSTTRNNFEGHVDSLDIVRRQIQENDTVYRPRKPHPMLDGPKNEMGDKDKCNDASSHTGNNAEALQDSATNTTQTPEGEKIVHQDGLDSSNEHVASQQNITAIVAVQSPRQENQGHQKIEAITNPTPLPELHNDKVGFARSA